MHLELGRSLASDDLLFDVKAVVILQDVIELLYLLNWLAVLPQTQRARQPYLFMNIHVRQGCVSRIVR